MLSIDAISDADYYLGGPCSACGTVVREHAAEYELAAIAGGEPPGRWIWRGSNALGLTGVITPEGQGGEAFRLLINELRDPSAPKVWVPDKTPSGRPSRRHGSWRHPTLGVAPQTFKTLAERVAAWRRKHPEATPEQVAEYETTASGDDRSAKHAWDLTFSPPKSWSVLHAALQWAGRHDEAEKLWAALEAGVAAALDHLFEELAYIQSRPTGPEIGGSRTARYERAQNVQMAMFRHHTSRDGDPQCHLHVTLINRALNAEGLWRALYSPAFYSARHGADAVFLRTAEAEATRALGLCFASTEDDAGPVDSRAPRPTRGAREIVGVPEAARVFFSSRSRALNTKAQEMVDDFTATKGRAPSGRERWRIQQRATLQTRNPKPQDPPSRAERVERWEREFSRDTRASFEYVLRDVDAESVDPGEPLVVPSYDRDAVITLALADLADTTSGWSVSKLTDAIDRRLPGMLAVEPGEVRAELAGLVARALRSPEVVAVSGPPAVDMPASLRDPRTGRSVFTAPDSVLFTCRRTVDRESALVARLDQRGARWVPPATAATLASGRGLAPEQQSLVADVLSSGRFLEVVDAYAGSGKTTAMRGLSQALTDQWGVGLVGITIAENPAQVMRAQGVARAFNAAAFLDFADREARGEIGEHERAQFAVARGSFVALDEASTFDSRTLVRVVDELARRGVGKVILIGDREQADPVDAGGAFELLVNELEERRRQHLRDQRAGDKTSPARAPAPVHLPQSVHRFTHRWERDASTRLHERDVTALHQYATRGRLHGDIDRGRVREQAVGAFVDDVLADRDSIIVTATTEEASAAADLARQRLVEVGHVEPDGVALRDDTCAGVGDLVQSRVNDRPVGALNRQRWLVVGRTSVGALEVREDRGRDEHGERRWGPTLTLPPRYVRDSVELAYSATVHAFEGTTVRGSSHTIASRMMGFAHLYVGLTRGTDENHVYVELDAYPELERARAKVVALEHRHAAATSPEDRASVAAVLAEAREHQRSVEPLAQTPMARLAGMVSRNDHQPAARTLIQVEQDRARNLGHLGPIWESLIRECRASAHRQMVVGHFGADQAQAVFEDPAVAKVFGLIRGAEVSGHEPDELIAAVRRHGLLAGARSPASVLYKRLKDEMATGPLPRPVPIGFAARTPPTSRGDWDNERLEAALQVGRAMDERKAFLAERVALDRDEWAVRAVGPVPDDTAGRARWQGQVAMAAAYRERYGVTEQRRALGERPAHADPERSWWWDVAATGLGVPERERRLALLDDADLLARVQSWRRISAWLPPNVDEPLRECHVALQEARRQATTARTRELEPAEVEAAEAVVAEVATEVARWERVAEVRARGYAARTEEREAAQEARAELTRRGWSPDPEPVVIPSQREPEPAEVVKPELGEAERLAAVHEHQQRFRLDEVPEFGSDEWCALERDDPRRRAAVEASAASWFRAGEPLSPDDVEALSERLAAARDEMAEPERESPSAVQVRAVADYTGPLLWNASGVPEYGSSEWVGADEEVRELSSAVAALREWNVGESLSGMEAEEERLEAASAARHEARRPEGLTRTEERAAELAEAGDRKRRTSEVAEPDDSEVPEPSAPADEPLDRSRFEWVHDRLAEVEVVREEPTESDRTIPDIDDPDPGPECAEDQPQTATRAELDEALARATAVAAELAEEEATRAEPDEPVREPELDEPELEFTDG